MTFDILNAAAERWAKNGPKDYDFDLELTGVNPGVAHIEVRGGEVTAMSLNGRPTAAHLGQLVGPGPAGHHPPRSGSVPGRQAGRCFLAALRGEFDCSSATPCGITG